MCLDHAPLGFVTRPHLRSSYCKEAMTDMQGLKMYFFNKSKIGLALPWYLLCVLQCASISIRTLGLTQCWLEQTNVEVVLHEVLHNPVKVPFESGALYVQPEKILHVSLS